MQTMAEEWIEEGKQIGLQEGRQNQRIMILRVLQKRFQPAEEIQRDLAQQLAKISDDKILLHLVDLALEVMILPDFRARLQGLLAASH